jgi:dTDP-4-amino-4,6-dideoxygalactose transaminase
MNQPVELGVERRFVAEHAHSPLVPVARSVAPNRERFAQYLAQMCDTRRFSNFGPLHETLRARLCKLLQAEHLALFANATLALTIALRAHRASGGEVITTPFSFAASAQAIEWAAATPVFVDIDPLTLTMDPQRVEAAITPLTKAILAVHIYGVPCDVVALQAIAKRHRLALIFDAAHAFDTRIDGVPIHQFGDATIYSTHASKLFHTSEGGILICRDRDTQTCAERMSNFGFDGTGDAVVSGTNAKMSELHAAMGLSVLPEIAAERIARAALRLLYAEAFASIHGVEYIQTANTVGDSLQYAAIRLRASNVRDARHADNAHFSVRDAVHDALLLHGIQTRKYFYPLCSEFSYARSSSSRTVGALAHAREAAEALLCLPFHSAVSDRTVRAIRALLLQTLEPT